MIFPKTLINNLQKLYSNDGEERGGYITSDFKIVEVENIATEKDNNFMFKCDDLEKLESSDIIATFHTHVKKSSNLSKEDYDSFLNWEKLLHFIIGQDKISCYKVTDKATVIIEEIE